MLNPEEQRHREHLMDSYGMPLAYLAYRRASRLNGMEAYSASACFHRLRDLCWPREAPETAPFLSQEQRTALIAFEEIYHSLPWRPIADHPHISELPGDDLSPLVPAGKLLLRLVWPYYAFFKFCERIHCIFLYRFFRWLRCIFR